MTPHFHLLPTLNTSVACYEGGNSSGPPLLLLHGNSLASAATYSALWADPALAHFRLLAFDWPGCGASPRAAPEAGLYGLTGLRRVLPAVWQALELQGALVVAHSLAGHILLDVLDELTALGPVRGALLVGTPPLRDAADLATAFRPDPRLGSLFTAEVSEAQTEELIDVMLHPAQRPAHAAALRQALRQSDPAFRAALAADIGAGLFVDELAALTHSSVPLTLAQGEADGVINAAYFAGLPGGFPLHLLPEAGHLPMLEQPIAFSRLVQAMAAATAPAEIQ